MNSPDGSKALLDFMANATNSLKSALLLKPKVKRNVNHRRYIEKQLLLNGINYKASKPRHNRQSTKIAEEIDVFCEREQQIKSHHGSPAFMDSEMSGDFSQGPMVSHASITTEYSLTGPRDSQIHSHFQSHNHGGWATMSSVSAESLGINLETLNKILPDKTEFGFGNVILPYTKTTTEEAFGVEESFPGMKATGATEYLPAENAIQSDIDDFENNSQIADEKNEVAPSTENGTPLPLERSTPMDKRQVDRFDNMTSPMTITVDKLLEYNSNLCDEPHAQDILQIDHKNKFPSLLDSGYFEIVGESKSDGNVQQSSSETLGEAITCCHAENSDCQNREFTPLTDEGDTSLQDLLFSPFREPNFSFADCIPDIMNEIEKNIQSPSQLEQDTHIFSSFDQSFLEISTDSGIQLDTEADF